MSNTEDKKEILDNSAETARSAQGEQPTEAQPQKPAKKPHREYGARMRAFEGFYVQILACVAAIIAIAVAAAVMYNVIVGVIVSVCAAFFYKYMVNDKLKRSLGIGYKTVVGGLELTYCKAVYGGVIWIPARLIWHDVISIGANALKSSDKHTLTRIFLPRTLTSISPDAFCGCDTLREIYFEGTEAEWQAIEGSDKLEGYFMLFEVKYPPVPKKKKKTVNTTTNTKQDKISDN